MKLDQLESYEDIASRKFFQYKEHEGKTIAWEYKGSDPARKNNFNEIKKMFHVDLAVLEEDGSVTEYYSQWLDGGWLFAFFSDQQRGFSTIRKLIKKPKRGGYQSWGLAAPAQAEYDALRAHFASQDAKVAEATEKVAGKLPWEKAKKADNQSETEGEED